jgi:colanic acid biosynthesis protein WcaH
MLDDYIFKTVIDSVPLVSIDILLKKDNKILLGKIINKPAQGYFFSTGGRVNKNENIGNAMSRIAKNELNIGLKLTPRKKRSWGAPEFIGVFDRFYGDSVYKDVSIHCVNLAYEYQWFAIDELLESTQIRKKLF